MSLIYTFETNLHCILNSVSSMSSNIFFVQFHIFLADDEKKNIFLLKDFINFFSPHLNFRLTTDPSLDLAKEGKKLKEEVSKMSLSLMRCRRIFQMSGRKKENKSMTSAHFPVN